MCSIFSKNWMVNKVDKVSKMESSSANGHLRQLSGSSGISKASPSKRVSRVKESEAKKLVSRSSNNHLDGIKTITSKLSCTRPVTESPSPKSNGAILLNKNAAWGSRYLCYFGGSKSKPSKPEQAVTEVKTGEPSSKKDPRPVMKKSLVASPKVGNPSSSSNIEKKSGVTVKMDRSKQSNPAAQVSKVEPRMKMQIPKTPGPVNPSTRSKFHIHQPRTEPSAYNLRKRVEKSEAVKDSVVAPERKKIVKKERPKASAVQKPVDLKGSVGIQKRETQRKEKLQTSVPKVSAAPVKMISATNTSMQYQPDQDEGNHPSSSHYDPYADDYYLDDPYEDAPIYHIKWDGDDEEHWQCGQTCLYCDKDLSCSPDGDDHGPDEDDEFNEYKYRIEFTPQLLPAVDFLPCGHAFHTKCLTDDAIPEVQSADPVCVLCLSMS
ncbi:hypothetical protein Tco_0758059 [Tanacetum coccineum]